MARRTRRMAEEAGGERRSACPVACTLDLVGDRWTLLVVRDLLLGGPRRFGELLGAPEGIPTNVLAERLRRLEGAGIVEARAYSDRPPRREYALTARGRALGPVVRAAAAWGLAHLEGTRPPPGLGLAAIPASPAGASAPPRGRRRRRSRA